MKLTKGQISKLYNRKKQTLRKKKPSKRKSSKKNRTFRKKIGVNLSNKTLKRIRYKKHKGGENDIATTPTLETPIEEQDLTPSKPAPEEVKIDEPALEDLEQPGVCGT